MSDTPTPNYGLTRPDKDDAMSDFGTWLNGNWTTLENAVSPNSGTTLPQSGSYNVGDRFYKTDTKSIYILVVKSALWGWHWRPIQDAISPWLTIPTTVLTGTGSTWTLNPVAANPFAIAFDNRGKCYWRGVVGPSSGTIGRNANYQIFQNLPTGLSPSRPSSFMVGHETLAISTTGSSLQSWQGAKVFLPNDGSVPTIRAFGGNADFNRLYMNQVHYAVGAALYTTP